jgi:formylglycine-generating enzyme required for sulfatase activity
MVFQTSPTEPPTTQAEALAPSIQPTLSITSENAPTQSIALTAELTQPIPTLNISTVPSDIASTALPIDSAPDTNCANAPKRLHLGIEAQVVTRPITNNNLMLRKAPEANATILERLAFGTIVTVINGPSCGFYDSGYFWWWEVQTQQSKETGWVVEGKDDIDLIYILPINPKDGATFIYIPPGEFTMGLTSGQVEILTPLCRGNVGCENLIVKNSGTNKVNLPKGYWIYRTEVSNAQYAKCVDCVSSKNLADNYPVVGVNWDQANQYCNWAGGRLPTSAEWEYAARGGDGRLFPWEIDEIPDGSQANVWIPNSSQTNTSENPNGKTTEVDDYADGASPFGLLNMAGNVWEWVDDWYNFDTNEKVGRGGSSWIRHPLSSVAIVDSWGRNKAGDGVGFRCALDQQP